ncbi:MAG TPA: ABC transporter permease [Thermomicrobiales bacterium]|jgi:NitT/TauT family transport system permease protein|nr:ABC transporter permease [Thermomicrobiales bacterium]
MSTAGIHDRHRPASATTPGAATDRPKRRGNRGPATVLLTLSGPVVILLTWELLARTGTIDDRFWPAPSSLWPAAVDLWREDDLAGDIRLTIIRILGGFLLGSIPAVVVGLAMGLSWPIRTVLMPIATVVYALPKIALLPLMLIAFGTGEASKLAIVALSIFFLVALNTMSGVLAIDPGFRDVARNFGASPLATFRTVALPGALPSIFTGLRLAMGFALVVIVGTEFLSARQGGLGDLIWQSWQILAIRDMYVGLLITGVLGWMLTVGLDVIERVVIPWQRERR